MESCRRGHKHQTSVYYQLIVLILIFLITEFLTEAHMKYLTPTSVVKVGLY